MGSSRSQWPHEDPLRFRPAFQNPKIRAPMKDHFDPLWSADMALQQHWSIQSLSAAFLAVKHPSCASRYHKCHAGTWEKSLTLSSSLEKLDDWRGQICTNICTIFEEFHRHSTPFHPFQPFLFCCNTAIMTCHPLCDGLGWTLTPHRHTVKMLCLQARSQHMQGGILIAEFSSFP